MTTHERIEMLREAQEHLSEAIDQIARALQATSHEAHAEAYIIAHLNNWIDSEGYDHGIEQYIEEIERE